MANIKCPLKMVMPLTIASTYSGFSGVPYLILAVLIAKLAVPLIRKIVSCKLNSEGTENLGTGTKNRGALFCSRANPFQNGY